MMREWVREVRDQCEASEVAFFLNNGVVSVQNLAAVNWTVSEWSQFPDIQSSYAAL